VSQRVFVHGFGGETLLGDADARRQADPPADARGPEQAPKMEELFADLGLPATRVKALSRWANR
jgi:hypothetical protein